MPDESDYYNKNNITNILFESLLVNRRTFISYLLFLGGCASSPKTIQRNYYESLPPNYKLIVNPKNNFRYIEGKSLKIDRQKVILAEETFIDKYHANPSGFVDTGKNLVSNPGHLLGCLVAWPICAAAGAIVATHSVISPDESKYLKKERTVIKSENIKETTNENILDDKERALNIIISNSQNYKELIVVNTNNHGTFIFDFEKAVIDEKLAIADYSIDFFHNLIDKPVSIFIPSAIVASIISNNKVKMRPNKSKRPFKQHLTSKNRSNWFLLINSASSVKSSIQTTKEIYQLYRDYRFERRFFELLFKRIIAPNLIAFAVEEAIICFVRWLFKTYRKDLIKIFGKEVLEIIPL